MSEHDYTGEVMLNILLTTARPEVLRSFTEALSSDPEVRLEQVASAADALKAVRTSSPHLAVIDFELPDARPLDLVSELLMIDAMVSTAVMSLLSEEEFHEVSEGLGVLARLPAEPETGDAAELLGKLRGIIGLPR
jgi:DNA-binding NarL/FixJ family response regulator